MKRISIYGAILGLLSLLTYSCCGVYDDLGNCPQDLCIRFYNQTSCDEDGMHPERLNDLNHATLAFYDQSGQLVKTVATKLSEAETDGWKYIVTRAPKAGKYKMVCWTTSNIKAFETENLKKGTQAKDEIWKLNGSFKPENNIPPVFYGGKDVEIIDHSEDGTVTDTINCNVLEYRHTINLTISGLSEEFTYTAEIVQNNTSFDFNGAYKDAPFTFERNLEVVSKKEDPFKVGSSFSIAKLSREIKHPELKLYLIDKKGEKTLAKSYDLMKLIDSIKSQYHTLIDLECTPVINIDMQVELKTYMALVGRINNWNVVLRGVDLDN